jgi:hypothetical protein
MSTAPFLGPTVRTIQQPVARAGGYLKEQSIIMDVVVSMTSFFWAPSSVRVKWS